MGGAGKEKLAFTNDSRMKKTHKRILMAALFLFGVALLFFPVRLDHVSGVFSENGLSGRKVVPASIDYYSSVFAGFNGHPVGIAGIIFFALMPFFVVWQSFSIQRPFGLAATAFLKLEATFMFIGAPYVWYMITYEHGYFRNTVHETSPAFAGWILIGYELICGVLLFAMLADPKGKLARLFD